MNLLSECIACELCNKPFHGKGSIFAKIVFVSGQPLIGKTNKRIILKTLKYLDLKISDIYITSAIKCMPNETIIQNKHMLRCYPWLMTELIMIQPDYIVTMGELAFKSVCGIGRLKDSAGTLIYPNDERVKIEGLPNVFAVYSPSKAGTNSKYKKKYMKSINQLKGLLGTKVEIEEFQITGVRIICGGK